MSAERKELQEALCQYTRDTLICIDTVRGFCEKMSEWVLRRKTESNLMEDIKERADKMDLNFSHVKQSENIEALLEYIESKVTCLFQGDSMRVKLEQELAAVLKDTLGGLEKLDCFLDAVERLAITSRHVFNEENRVLHLPKEISPDSVQVVIIAARLVCPLLLQFKRDAKAFFLPKLQNVQVLVHQLDKYIRTTQKICDKLEKSCSSKFSLKMATNPVVDLDVIMSEDDIRRMLCHINQLEEMRMDESFRMVFLFKEESGGYRFISEFSKRQPMMLQSLNILEESAVQLDRMNKGAKISSVVGSSVSGVGNVLSIVGLALIPATAGVSLALILAGMGLGAISALNSLGTTATEIGVNNTYQKKASEAFKSFMEDVQSLQECLDEVTNREASQIDVAVAVSKVLCKVGLLGKVIALLVDAASAVKSFMEDVQSLQECLDKVTNREASQIDVAVAVSKVLFKVGLVVKRIDLLVDAASAVKSFMEDLQSLQDCLDKVTNREVSSQTVTNIEASQKAEGEIKLYYKVERVIKKIDSFVDSVSDLKSQDLIAGKVVAEEGKALHNVPRVVSDIPDAGQAAFKGPLALSKSARIFSIVFNAFSLGVDIFFICKDSISLAKGSETEVSQSIRATAALWSSEMDSWKKIHDLLCQGLLTSGKKGTILEMPFELDQERSR